MLSVEICLLKVTLMVEKFRNDVSFKDIFHLLNLYFIRFFPLLLPFPNRPLGTPKACICRETKLICSWEESEMSVPDEHLKLRSLAVLKSVLWDRNPEYVLSVQKIKQKDTKKVFSSWKVCCNLSALLLGHPLQTGRGNNRAASLVTKKSSSSCGKYITLNMLQGWDTKHRHTRKCLCRERKFSVHLTSFLLSYLSEGELQSCRIIRQREGEKGFIFVAFAT